MATKNDHNNTKTKDGSWLVMEEEDMDISSKIKMLITSYYMISCTGNDDSMPTKRMSKRRNYNIKIVNTVDITWANILIIMEMLE